MVIAVASGKGGTGKTTVAVSLAQALHQKGVGPILVSDCDVEAPNAQIFLKADLEEKRDVFQYIPRVDLECCSGCGICGEVCQFNAILVVSGKPKVFPSLCHACGSCVLQCPEEAVDEIPYQIGLLERGPVSPGLDLRQGSLQEGEPLAVPVISALRNWNSEGECKLEIIDAPPGASCPVVEAVRKADFLLLVTEPTAFGLHDLKSAIQVARELKIPAGVVINRTGVGQEDIRGFCQDAGLPIFLEIPLDRTIGEGLARGKTLLEIDPSYLEGFLTMWHQIEIAGQDEGTLI